MARSFVSSAAHAGRAHHVAASSPRPNANPRIDLERIIESAQSSRFFFLALAPLARAGTTGGGGASRAAFGSEGASESASSRGSGFGATGAGARAGNAIGRVAPVAARRGAPSGGS